MTLSSNANNEGASEAENNERQILKYNKSLLSSFL